MAILPLEMRTEKRDSFIFCVNIRFILFLQVSTIALQFLCEAYSSCDDHDTFDVILLEKLISMNMNLVLLDKRYVAYD